MNNVIIDSIKPLEKRPLHHAIAAAKGMTENYETIFVIKGFSDGHIHAPLISGARYFRPFTKHSSTDKFSTIVQVKREDPSKPFKGGDLEKYEGIVDVYENVSRVIRPIAGRGKDHQPIWITRELKLTLLESITGIERTLHLKNVLAWRSGTDGIIQPKNMIPFCVKAVELTPKEIASYTKLAKQHERVAL